MAEGVGSVVESENGSFQSQITRRLPRKASRAAMSAWKPLCVKKSPRGDPRAGAAAKRSVQRASIRLSNGACLDECVCVCDGRGQLCVLCDKY